MVLNRRLNVDMNHDKESLTRGHGGDEWTGTPENPGEEQLSRTARQSRRFSAGSYSQRTNNLDPRGDGTSKGRER